MREIKGEKKRLPRKLKKQVKRVLSVKEYKLLMGDERASLIYQILLDYRTNPPSKIHRGWRMMYTID